MLEEIEKTILELISNGLEDSADKLCSLLVNSEIFLGNEMKLNELQGDCSYSKLEYSRALQYYKQALNGGQMKKIYHIDTPYIANLHYKVSQCLLKLNDKTAAIRELEVIPKELRTTKINISLGKLYYGAELKLSANGALKQVLKSCPLAIECMEMLINLGTETTEFIPKTKLESQSQSNDLISVFSEWINPIIESYSLQHHSKHSEAKEKLQISLQLFPKSSYLHTQAALCAYDAENIEESIQHFRHVRLHDSKQIYGMDKYGLLLYSQCLNLPISSTENSFITLPRKGTSGNIYGVDMTGYREDLCKLATDLLFDYPKHPIAWSCAALYTDIKGDKDKAMLFIDKACTKLEPRMSMSFNIKGILHLVRESPEQAAISFSQANSLEKNVDSYTGIAESNFQMGKSSDVLENVKSALKFRPNSSRCFTLVARALAKSGNQNSKKDAIKGFKKAIRLNPSNISPVLELSDLLCAEGQYEEAAIILQTALETNPAYLLRCYYGKVLGKLREYEKAIKELHFAMSSCPGLDISLAAHEVDQIEALLRGQDLSFSNEYNDTSLKSYESPTSG